MSLFVGDALHRETEKAFERTRYPRAEVVHRSGSSSLLTRDRQEGATPIFEHAPKGMGGHLVVVDRNASTIEFDAAKFTKYLKSEGLERIVEERAKRGEARKAGRERYSRCLKSLVQIGPQKDNTYAKRTGQTLEILPKANPAFLKPGAALEVSVEFRGKALEGAQLEALSLHNGKLKTQRTRTSGTGTATVNI
ncbi:MAG: DUF4198 domain-containing protein, partial [Myxococcota bacterium]